MLNVKDFTDIQLLSSIKNDSECAFNELYDRYWKQLYLFAYKRVKSREVAEEIVQDFLTNFWANRKKVNIQTSFEGYIYTSIKHLVLNYFAKEARKALVIDNLAATNTHEDNSTQEVILLHELHTVIAREVNCLPAKCRSVFELSRMQNKSNKEIAQVLGISEKTVEGHLSKALKRLRVTLNLITLAVITFLI
jgi:RNA polymerase sigma-70 factor (family 1)